ncbi:MAG: HDIG domain-containing protein [Opitutales bacterium]|nr:HDIG domain-containing protein [Opitutales bacterium]
MAVFRRNRKESYRRRRIQAATGQPGEGFAFDRRGLANSGLFAALAVLIIVVCFAGLSPPTPVIREGQVARTRVTADFDFTYRSEIETRALQEERGRRVPPVYRIEMAGYESFKGSFERILEALQTHFSLPDADAERPRPNAEAIAEAIRRDDIPNPHNLSPGDLAVVFGALSPRQRREASEEALQTLRDVLRQGIYETDESPFGDASGRLSRFNVFDDEGRLDQVDIQPYEEALRSLRINLSALDVPRHVSIAYFRMLREGLQPNVRFDEEKTNALVARTQAAVEPVTVSLRQGDTILEPNTRVSARQVEQLEAYRRALRHAEAQERTLGLDPLFIERALLVIIVVLGAALYLRISRISIAANQRIITYAGLLVLFNLLIIRLLFEFRTSGVAEANPVLSTVVPFFTPVALGPMIITMLLGVAPGVLAAAFIGILNAMMYGNSLHILVASHLTALVAIYFCRNIQMRARVVRAGFFSGLVLASAAILIGLRDSVEWSTVIYQVFAAAGAGALTGVIVVGILPFWENLFKVSTDITLLELTDFNHPLLRRLQMEAPGSYHHSLMVANLAENAAARIGANPLVCRVCSLYHDIGKMVKPEYFTENQRDGYNPHIERNPSMSALVIKAHVKEGVQLAREYKLPRIIVDVIREHHGTSLIQYFYYKALEQQRVSALPDSPMPNAPRVELDKVNEDTYRYEGPRPHFVESTLIMLADSVEAAGRCLRKVTPQSIDELLEKIFQQRLEDSQLDDAPLTIRDLAAVRESFSFTLLNMLHARIEYPEDPEAERKARKRAARKSASPFAEAAERAAARETGATPSVLPEDQSAPKSDGDDVEPEPASAAPRGTGG